MVAGRLDRILTFGSSEAREGSPGAEALRAILWPVIDSAGGSVLLGGQRRGLPLTSSVTAAESLPGTGSATAELTDAVFVTDVPPPAVTLAVTVTVATPPPGIVPSGHVTIADPLHAPMVELAEMSSRPDGSAFVTATAPAASGPWLTTLNV
jgi:hypothetical protein